MKIDLHLHTTASADGVHSPATMVRAAKGKVDGVAITDHDSVKGWKEAVKAGKENGIFVILGEEITVWENNLQVAHVLGLFLKKKIKSKTLPEIAKEIHSQGGILVAAHPFDKWRGTYGSLGKYLRHFDAIEVFNSHSLFHKDNEKALDFAKKNRMPITGGSDAHSKYEIGFGYTEARAKNLAEFKKAIQTGRTKVCGRKTSLIYQGFAVLSKRGLYPFRG